MKIFLAHNYYQNPGGEDGAFKADAAILEAHGHDVHRFTMHNDAVKAMSRVQVIRATLWNQQVYQELRDLFTQHKFDVAHFHNTFPLISPAAYAAAQDSGVPVVQTLHNFRLVCPSAILYRDGHVCEDCLHSSLALPGILNGCYRGSRFQSGAVALLNTTHQVRKTWFTQVDRYIALTEFGRRKFIEAGFPAEKIAVRPNFLDADPGVRTGDGSYALFLGRLNPEKGVRTLLEAWRQIPQDIPLKIVGEGELKAEAQAAITQHGLNVELLGWRSPAEVLDLIKAARFVIFPSEWYETFGRVVIEAFACGVPVIASKLGASTETVEHGRTGLHFEAGNPASLAETVRNLWGDVAAVHTYGSAGRREFELKYTAERNYDRLVEIYQNLERNPVH
ncbi:MAG: glycosyltransferase family 4 protein [Anaerolineae bacterium]|nr:glycosyltransferase family 4 protein [Anaerolineae bacterium]